MFYNQTIKIAFLISLTGHLLALGIPLDLFKYRPKKPEYITVQIEEPRILPKIEKMGDEKILEKSSAISDTTTPAKEAMLRYQDMIKQRIEEARQYPAWAEERKLEGIVQLRFSIYSNGQLGTIHILHPSGYNILDQSALKTIKKASPFPPIPKEIDGDSVNIEVSIVYLLNG